VRPGEIGCEPPPTIIRTLLRQWVYLTEIGAPPRSYACSEQRQPLEEHAAAKEDHGQRSRHLVLRVLLVHGR
jgi:hypothetical protein